MNTEPTGSDAKPDPAIVALARAAERTTRKLKQLDGDVRALAEAVSRGGGPGAAAADSGPERGLRTWLLADDPDLAAEALIDLTGWLHEVYLHYPDTTLAACWLWHPAVVEELWWLRCAHADAYDTEAGSWLRVGDWHDRQRPGVARRVRAVLGKCDLSRHAPHRDRPTEITGPAAAPLARHALLIAAAWTNGRELPQPDVEQLQEAEIHNREHLWKHR